MTPQQLEERKVKGLFFNCDNKYSKGHKCGEKKLFYIDCEEEDIPKGIPPTRNHDHEIHLILGSVSPNIRPYRYPYSQKSEIERMVE